VTAWLKKSAAPLEIDRMKKIVKGQELAAVAG